MTPRRTDIVSPYFDFAKEAAFAAVNEVCCEADPEAWKSCTVDALCPSCTALSMQIKGRLIAAFQAGMKAAQQAPVAGPSLLDIVEGTVL